MELENNNAIKETKQIGILILLFMIIFGGYKLIMNNRILNNGVFVKCIVIKTEGRKGGTTVTVSYPYKGIKYKSQFSSGRDLKIGEEYFIKLLPTNPDAIVFLEDNPVPECLININSPFEGWKELPVCVTKN